MDLKKIESLVRIIEESSIQEFTYKDADLKITLSKREAEQITVGAPAMAPMMGMPGMPSQAATPAPAAEEAPEEDDTLFIVSPIVGTFYSASAPDAPAYVKVGDHVKNGETVCILEAMKLMNEIQAEFDCEIEAVLVSNEQKVEYGQPLFRVKKL